MSKVSVLVDDKEGSDANASSYRDSAPHHQGVHRVCHAFKSKNSTLLQVTTSVYLHLLLLALLLGEALLLQVATIVHLHLHLVHLLREGLPLTHLLLAYRLGALPLLQVATSLPLHAHTQ